MIGHATVAGQEVLQAVPHVALADQQVLVGGIVGDLLRREADADRVASGDEVEQRLCLDLGERVLVVVGGDQRQHRADRIGGTDHRVGAHDGDLVDAPRLDDVAEVDQAAHVTVRVDEDVVVVGVVVDDLSRLLAEAGATSCTK